MIAILFDINIVFNKNATPLIGVANNNKANIRFFGGKD
jgi:hypothetical protein